MASTVNDRSRGGAGLPMKAPCRVATTANINLRNLQIIDGVLLANSDRILVKDQTVASENGIYLARQTAWDRAPDFDGPGDVVQGTLVYTNNGNVGADILYKVTTADPITIDVTGIAFDAVATVQTVSQATEDTAGVVRLASPAATVAGAETDTATTPAGVAVAVDAAVAVAVDAAVAAVETHEADAGAHADLFSGKAALQTYVEGTFTPVLAFGGDTTGITYGAQAALYTRIGRVVHFAINILLSSKGSSTGNATVSGLPFTGAGGSNFPIVVFITGMTSGVGDTYVQGFAQDGATTLSLFDISAGSQANLTDVDFTNTSRIRISGTYFA